MAYAAAGQAIKLAINTQPVDSRESSFMMLKTDAPQTLRIPISLVRRLTETDVSPKTPRQAIKTAMTEEYPTIRFHLFSLTYCASTSSSRKE